MSIGLSASLILRIDPHPRERANKLVGRQGELAFLREEAEASAVSGRAILIRGDAGIGKSALLHEIFAVVEHTHTVALGSCVELESRRPLAVFAEVLRSLERSLSLRTLRGAIRAHGAEIDALLKPDASTRMTNDVERYGVYVAFMNVFDALARERPLLIALEDMQWADEASTQLFAYLAKRATNRPWLLLATARTEIDDDRPLRQVAADLTTSRVIKELVLGPLDAAGTRELITSQLGLAARDPGDLTTFADLIHGRSAGSPLFTEELLRTLTDTGQLRHEAGHWQCARADVENALPTSIVDGMRARVARLSPAARQVVTAAAVAGDVVDFALLTELLGMDDAALSAPLHEALASRLLAEASDGTIRFRHALIRHAVAHTLLAPERRQIHRRIAELLTRRPPDPARGETLAYHFDNAGMADRARESYLDAAWHAVATLETRSAVRMFERAAELTPEDHPRRAGTLEHLVRFLFATDRLERAEAAARSSLAAAERQRDPLAIGRALLAIARSYTARSDLATAREFLTRAGAVLEPLGATSDLALYHTALSWHALARRDAATSLAEAEAALAIAEGSPIDDDPDDRIAGGRRTAALAASLNFAGCALLELERWDEALDRLRRSYELSRTSRDPATVHSSTNNFMVGLLGTGADPAELRRLWGALRAFRQTRTRHGAALVLGLNDHLLEADFDGFWRAMPDLAAAPRRIRTEAEMLAAWVAFAQRDTEEAFDGLASARGVMVEDGNAPLATFTTRLALVFAGRPGQAAGVGRVDEGEIAEGWMSVNETARAALVGTVAARRAGLRDLTIASATRATSDTALRLLMYPAFRAAQAPFVAAELALLDGRCDDAVAALGTAIDELQKTSCVHLQSLWLEQLARLERAEALVERGRKGDRAMAQAEVDAVAEYWRRGKALHFLTRLAEWADARRLRVSMPHLPAATPSPLTEREDEIARLVARGLTNREIAEQLTLSVRTVESHLEQIRAKLEFHTRAQIAAWVVERSGSLATS